MLKNGLKSSKLYYDVTAFFSALIFPIVFSQLKIALRYIFLMTIDSWQYLQTEYYYVYILLQTSPRQSSFFFIKT